MGARRHYRTRLEDLAEQQASYTNARARRARRRQQERRDSAGDDHDRAEQQQEETDR
jgi:hypothetical protein